MQFVGKGLARRLESAEEMPQVDCARMFQQLRSEVGAAFEPFCGGHMIFAGLNSPIGHAAGLGFDGPVKASDLDTSKPSTARTTRQRNSICARSPTRACWN